MLLIVASSTVAEIIGSWSVDREHQVIVSHPAPVWDAGDAGVYVSCKGGVPSVTIRVRDPVPNAPNVRIQFGGQSGRAIVFIGKGGVIRKFNGFSRGQNRRDVVANRRDSDAIVRELLQGRSRLAWEVDNEDGFDSLEIRTTNTGRAIRAIGCNP
jgi:hypothetical protein